MSDSDTILKRDYGLEKINIQDFILEHNLPSSSKFLGYIVALLETDEFLAVIHDDGLSVAKGIVKTPSLAKVFDLIDDALNAAKEFSYSVDVCILFDIDDQYAVISICTN